MNPTHPCIGLGPGRPRRFFERVAWLRKAPARAVLALLAAIAAPAGPSAADPGPVSSETVTISVSVAPRYALRAIPLTAEETARSGRSGRYCIATNSRPLTARLSLLTVPDETLPVETGPAGSPNARELPQCSARNTQASAPSPSAGVPAGTRLMIVRPE